MSPTPNEQDAMKDIERMLAEFGDASGAMVALAGGRGFYDAQERRNNARAALLAAIRKLVSSTLPAQSQDAQPVAYVSEADMELLRANKWAVVEVSAYLTLDNGGNVPLYASPTIPQAGKVLEALTKMLDAMDMQEKRERGEYHIPSETALCIWRDAQEAGREAAALLRSLPQEEAAAQMQPTLEDAYAEGRRDEQQELASVLPGVTYMDPPDGGAPTIREQLQRQAKDAARYLFWRDYYGTRFAIGLTPNGASRAVFKPSRPAVEAFGHDYRRKIDEALDAAMEAQHGG